MELFCFISFSILKNLKRKLFSDNRIFGQISTPARKRISSLVHRIEQQPTPHLLWFFSAGQQCERMEHRHIRTKASILAPYLHNRGTTITVVFEINISLYIFNNLYTFLFLFDFSPSLQRRKKA